MSKKKNMIATNTLHDHDRLLLCNHLLKIKKLNNWRVSRWMKHQINCITVDRGNDNICRHDDLCCLWKLFAFSGSELLLTCHTFNRGRDTNLCNCLYGLLRCAQGKYLHGSCGKLNLSLKLYPLKLLGIVLMIISHCFTVCNFVIVRVSYWARRRCCCVRSTRWY
jgi:hypothetical protein